MAIYVAYHYATAYIAILVLGDHGSHANKACLR